MKKTKKILALLLAAVMVVGLSVLAFAADEEDPTSVSYTHLDVYTRQGACWWHCRSRL